MTPGRKSRFGAIGPITSRRSRNRVQLPGGKRAYAAFHLLRNPARAREAVASTV